MRSAAPRLLLALAPLLVLVGCQEPDVGSRCQITWGSSTPAPTPQSIARNSHYFESGNFACEDLVCIVSSAPEGSRYGGCAGEACGYCSKPCVSDQDCYRSETGLVCDRVVLDESFFASMDEEVLQRYLGETQFSRYCVVPRQ